MPTRKQLRPKRNPIKLPQPNSYALRTWMLGKTLTEASEEAGRQGYYVQCNSTDGKSFFTPLINHGLTINVVVVNGVIDEITHWNDANVALKTQLKWDARHTPMKLQTEFEIPPEEV